MEEKENRKSIKINNETFSINTQIYQDNKNSEHEQNKFCTRP